jgi:hypothetical protein
MAKSARLSVAVALSAISMAGATSPAAAQSSARQPVPPIARLGTFAPGSIAGVVVDERGAPVEGVVVSALGATTTVAVTDKTGRYEFGTLTPGPYLLRAHLSGYVAPRAETVHVASNARSGSNLTLRREGTPVIVPAGFGSVEAAPVVPAAAAAMDPAAADSSSSSTPEATGAQDSDGAREETAWRIRHARRGILKDVSVPEDLLADSGRPDSAFGAPIDLVGWAVSTPTRAATAFFTETPFTGQLNLLTIGSFDTPQELFSSTNGARNIAFGRVSAPAGEGADWTVSGALTQSDISSWIVAGSYTTHAPAIHRYDVGLSVATARYDGGNLLALRDVSEGSRNAGIVYGYDTYSMSPAMALTYGATYARYDYLDDRGLLSPRVEMTVTPSAGTRLSAAVARRELAPGAEEFLPPSDDGVWIPAQRTFSSIDPRDRFRSEQTTHAEVAIERDFGRSTLALRGFRQHVDGQLVTVFGTEVAGQPASKSGHYLIGNVGDADALGCVAALRTFIASRVQGEIEYSLTKASLTSEGDNRYFVVLAPSAIRTTTENIHSLQGRVETDVPETATRVVMLYRVSNGFVTPGVDRPGIDGRFDVQVRQSLPFMNFSNARWEMLLAVRNFFREAATDQSVYDELLVVRPPKRVVGGVTLRF